MNSSPLTRILGGLLAAVALAAAPAAAHAVAPSGPAAGDLTGSFPNPQIAPNAITQDKIAPGAVRASAIPTWTYSFFNASPYLNSGDCLVRSFPASSAQAGDMVVATVRNESDRDFGFPSDNSSPSRGLMITNTAAYAGSVRLEICNVSRYTNFMRGLPMTVRFMLA